MNKICICLESGAQALRLRRVGIKAGDRRDERGGREGDGSPESPNSLSQREYLFLSAHHWVK